MLRKTIAPMCATCLLLWSFEALAIQQSNSRGAGVEIAESGARLFPASTAAFVEIPNLGEVVGELLNHPLRERIEQLQQVKKALNAPQMKQLRIGLAFLETQIEEKWLPALDTLTGGGLFIGFDPETEGIGVAFRATDEAFLKKTAGVVIGFIKNNGNQDLKIESYRGGKVARLEQATLARFNDWFLISNKDQLAQQMADNLLDGSAGLTANPAFPARPHRAQQRDAWAYVDLETLKRFNVAEELFKGATDEPGAELLFGGILEALKTAKTAVASLDFTDQGLSLVTQLPFDSTQFDESREFFFGPQGNGRAPQPLDIPNLVGQITTYRDIGRWWLSKEDLFPENVIAQLAQSDSQLSTVFGGMDFGQDVLGAFEPEMRIVVKRQEYKQDMKPDIEFPAFALVARMKNRDVERRFRIAFQSLIGFLNINAGQNDYPQFDLMTSQQDGIRVTGGEYLMDDEFDKGLMIFNFSPAIAFQGHYIVISSTTEFAEELAQATKKLDERSETSQQNTLLTINAEMVKKLLADNRQSMIAQSMVNSGKSRAQAEAEIDLVLGLMEYFKDGRMDYRIEPQQMELELQVNFQKD